MILIYTKYSASQEVLHTKWSCSFLRAADSQPPDRKRAAAEMTGGMIRVKDAVFIYYTLYWDSAAHSTPKWEDGHGELVPLVAAWVANCKD